MMDTCPVCGAKTTLTRLDRQLNRDPIYGASLRAMADTRGREEYEAVFRCRGGCEVVIRTECPIIWNEHSVQVVEDPAPIGKPKGPKKPQPAPVPKEPEELPEWPEDT